MTYFVRTEFQADTTEILARLIKDLRDCWEGCIPYREAIEMIGAPAEYRPALRRHWNGLNRRTEIGRIQFQSAGATRKR